MHRARLSVGVAVLLTSAFVLRTTAATTPQPTVALMEFRRVGDITATPSPYAGLTALVQVALQQGDAFQLVERETISKALDETAYLKFGNAEAGQTAIGRLVKADLIVRGEFHGWQPAGWRVIEKGKGRTTLQRFPDEQPDTSLHLRVIDPHRGIVLAKTVVGFADGILPATADSTVANEVAQALQTAAREADEFRVGLKRKIVIAPLYLRAGERVRTGEHGNMEETFFQQLAAMADPARHHLLSFDDLAGARGEGELVAAGLVDVDPDAWQSLADAYVWGDITTNSNGLSVIVSVWNGRGEPIRKTDTIAATTNATITPETLRPIISNLASAAIGTIPELNNSPPVADVRSRVAREFVAPYLAKEARRLEDEKRRGLTLPETWRAMGMTFLEMTPDQLASNIRAAEVAAFFDPSNQALREELLKLIDRSRGSAFDFGLEKLFQNSLRWGRNVDQFGLQTVAGSATSLRSGFKLEPYLKHWLEIWRQTGLQAGLNSLSPDIDVPVWMRQPGVREFIAAEARRRIVTTLDYLSAGRVVLGISRANANRHLHVFNRFKPFSSASMQSLLEPVLSRESGLFTASELGALLAKFEIAKAEMSKMDQLVRTEYDDARADRSPDPEAKRKASEIARARSYRLRDMRPLFAELRNDMKPAAFFPTDALLSFEIPAAKLPTLSTPVTIHSLPPDIKGTRFIWFTEDEDNNLWVYIDSGPRPNILGRFLPNSRRFEALPLHNNNAAAPLGNRIWVRDGRGAGYFVPPSTEFSLLEMTEQAGFPPATTLFSDGTNLYATLLSTIKATSHPPAEWSTYPTPIRAPRSGTHLGLPGVVAFPGLFVRKPDGPWLSLVDKIPDATADSPSHGGSASDEDGSWIASATGLVRFDNASEGLRFWPLSKVDLGVASQRATGGAAFGPRLTQWITRRETLLALSAESHPRAASPVRPSPLTGPVTALHRDGEWLWIACGRDLLAFHVPSDSWGGRLTLANPVHHIAGTPDHLWLGVTPLALVQIDKQALLREALEQRIADETIVTDWTNRLEKAGNREALLARFYRGEFSEVKGLLQSPPPTLSPTEHSILEHFTDSLFGPQVARPLSVYLKPNVADWWRALLPELAASQRAVAALTESFPETTRERLDRDRDGQLSAAERATLGRDADLVRLLHSSTGPFSVRARRMMAMYDTDGSGSLTAGEFQQLALDEISAVEGTTAAGAAVRGFIAADLDATNGVTEAELTLNPPSSPLGLPPYRSSTSATPSGGPSSWQDNTDYEDLRNATATPVPAARMVRQRVLSLSEIETLATRFNPTSIADVDGADPLTRFLAARHLFGIGTEQARITAGQHLRAAAEGGIVNAQYGMGDFWKKADPKQAVEWYTRAGRNGLVNALSEAAKIVRQMRQPDYVEHMRSLLLEAAKLGSKTAHVELSWYTLQDPAHPDFNKALEWMKRGFEINPERARFTVEYLFGNGLWPEADFKNALPWLRMGASKGIRDCQFQLGLNHRLGVGAETNPEIARQWLGSAHKLGHPLAARQLGLLESDAGGRPQNASAPDLRKAISWFEMGANMGDVRCGYELAQLHLKGQYPNRKGVIDLLRQGAEKGFFQSLELLDELDPKTAKTARAALKHPVTNTDLYLGTWQTAPDESPSLKIWIGRAPNGGWPLHLEYRDHDGLLENHVFPGQFNEAGMRVGRMTLTPLANRPGLLHARNPKWNMETDLKRMSAATGDAWSGRWTGNWNGRSETEFLIGNDSTNGYRVTFRYQNGPSAKDVVEEQGVGIIQEFSFGPADSIGPFSKLRMTVASDNPSLMTASAELSSVTAGAQSLKSKTIRLQRISPPINP